MTVGSVSSQTRWVWRMIVLVQLVGGEDVECVFKYMIPYSLVSEEFVASICAWKVKVAYR